MNERKIVQSLVFEDTSSCIRLSGTEERVFTYGISTDLKKTTTNIYTIWCDK